MTDLDFQKKIIDWQTVEQKTWYSAEEIHAGIWRYSEVIKPDMMVIKSIENFLKNNNYHKWSEALVGHGTKMPEYRDCYDFKYKTGMGTMFDKNNDDFIKFDEMYNKTKYAQLQAIKHYCLMYNISELRHWEATNFVKYENNQHFEYHSDHGFSYNCTLSMVSYPNDDYNGGELEFKIQNIKIKPKAGDVYLFPSNYMYPHRSCPVKKGVKYSMVTMLDYSEYFHTPEFYQSVAKENNK
jgi:hypothetical protein